MGTTENQENFSRFENSRKIRKSVEFNNLDEKRILRSLD